MRQIASKTGLTAAPFGKSSSQTCTRIATSNVKVLKTRGFSTIRPPKVVGIKRDASQHLPFKNMISNLIIKNTSFFDVFFCSWSCVWQFGSRGRARFRTHGQFCSPLNENSPGAGPEIQKNGKNTYKNEF